MRVTLQRDLARPSTYRVSQHTSHNWREINRHKLVSDSRVFLQQGWECERDRSTQSGYGDPNSEQAFLGCERDRPLEIEGEPIVRPGDGNGARKKPAAERQSSI